MGIAAFDVGAGIANQLGIKVPTSDDLFKMANGEIDKVLGNIKGTDIFKQATAIVDKLIAGGETDPLKLLNSLDWLL